MPESPLILIAEDDENHVLFIRRAFKKAQLLNPLVVVPDGEAAIAYLKGEGQFANRSEYPLPDLLLLDLRMPRKDGFQVLEWVRQEPGLSTLRVVVLTSSEDMRDVNRAYSLGANSFLVKPLDFENFLGVVQALQGYWLWLTKTPEISRPVPEKTPNA